LVPSKDFKNKAYLKKGGEKYKPFYRFSANPSSDMDKWSEYMINSGVLGKKLEKIIKAKYKDNKFKGI